jgi:hypothetical protein
MENTLTQGTVVRFPNGEHRVWWNGDWDVLTREEMAYVLRTE